MRRRVQPTNKATKKEKGPYSIPAKFAEGKLIWRELFQKFSRYDLDSFSGWLNGVLLKEWELGAFHVGVTQLAPPEKAPQNVDSLYFWITELRMWAEAWGV